MGVWTVPTHINSIMSHETAPWRVVETRGIEGWAHIPDA